MKAITNCWGINSKCLLRVLILWGMVNFAMGQVRYTDRYWTLGDHAALNFSDTANPVADYSISLGASNEASLCDSAGNLLLYSIGSVFPSGLTPSVDVTLVDHTHSYIKNGLMLHGSGSGGVNIKRLLLPAPGNDSLIYYFSILSNPSWKGLSFSLINLYSDSGRAEVIQKNLMVNIITYHNALTAIRHGNGRDWYIIAYTDTPPFNNADGAFHVFLLNSSGISGPAVYPLSNHGIDNNSIEMKSNKEGNQLVVSSGGSQLLLFDFDRCSGQISNKKIILNAYSMNLLFYTSAEFSASGRYVYVITLTKNQTTQNSGDFASQIRQYDSWAANVYQSEVVLYECTTDSISPYNGPYLWSGLKRGPDDKIYAAFYYQNKSCGIPNFQLYCPGFHNAYSDSLLVINYPDSTGTACNLVEHGQDIAAMGGRSCYSLPNNPNYELGLLTGSPCDTLTAGIDESSPATNPSMQTAYNTNSGIINLYAQGLRGKNIKVMLYDLQGRLIKTAPGKTNGSSFAYTLKVTDLRNALYIVQLQSDKEVLSAKVMVE